MKLGHYQGLAPETESSKILATLLHSTQVKIWKKCTTTNDFPETEPHQLWRSSPWLCLLRAGILFVSHTVDVSEKNRILVGKNVWANWIVCWQEFWQPLNHLQTLVFLTPKIYLYLYALGLLAKKFSSLEYQRIPRTVGKSTRSEY
jgi:hypothetical protein